uniref:Uncharacterized protein n=1 Tax=Paramoeba aestuarina TaxID=180227 RepID=A0A7S4NT10_9EUKA
MLLLFVVVVVVVIASLLQQRGEMGEEERAREEERERREKEIKLCDACCDGEVNIVNDLLHEGVSPNFFFFESTPLHQAAGNGHKQIVEMLLLFNADTTACDSKGRTAKEFSQQRGYNLLE